MELIKGVLTLSVDLHDTQKSAVFSIHVFQSGNGDIHQSQLYMLHHFLQYILTFCNNFSKLQSFSQVQFTTGCCVLEAALLRQRNINCDYCHLRSGLYLQQLATLWLH